MAREREKGRGKRTGRRRGEKGCREGRGEERRRKDDIRKSRKKHMYILVSERYNLILWFSILKFTG